MQRSNNKNNKLLRQSNVGPRNVSVAANKLVAERRMLVRSTFLLRRCMLTHVRLFACERAMCACVCRQLCYYVCQFCDIKKAIYSEKSNMHFDDPITCAKLKWRHATHAPRERWLWRWG